MASIRHELLLAHGSDASDAADESATGTAAGTCVEDGQGDGHAEFYRDCHNTAQHAGG